MKILKTNSSELDKRDFPQFKETFIDFLTESETNGLTEDIIKDVFAGDDIKEIVFLKGEGETFNEAISMIKTSTLKFNPLTAQRVVVMIKVKADKISEVIRNMDKFKESLNFAQKLEWGFSIDPNQERNYIIHVAEAELLDENSMTTIDISICDETFNVGAKWRESEKIKKAAEFINNKLQMFMDVYGNRESERRILMMTMLDLSLASYSFYDKGND